MFKQIAVAHEVDRGLEVLRLWPLSLAELGRGVLPSFPLREVYCPVADPRWETGKIGEMWPPTVRELVGKRRRKGPVIRVSRNEVLSYLGLCSAERSPIDFLLYSPARPIHNPSDRASILQTLGEWGCRNEREVLRRFGGLLLDVHDGDHVYVSAAGRGVIGEFFRCSIAHLADHTDSRRLNRVWRLLRSECAGHALIVAGCQATLVARKCARSVIDDEQKWELFRWESARTIYRFEHWTSMRYETLGELIKQENDTSGPCG